jgi:phage-related protein
MEKPLAWLKGEVKTPPFSAAARIEAGYLLRRLQQGERLSLPHSRPMPTIAPRCHELRIRDRDHIWRIVYRVDPDAILILAILDKKTTTTPKTVIDDCRRQLRHYDEHMR